MVVLLTFNWINWIITFCCTALLRYFRHFLKPLFLIFNGLAYVAYIITILAFILSKKATDENSDVIDDSSWLSTFYRIVSGINGLCFFLLTVSLLNYGSRLEKIVHAIKVKRQH